jgi:hypothetical protein
MMWPDNKSFAFTIVDDTDNSTLHNTKPVYDLLREVGLKTTKTVWIYPPRDKFTGDCLNDENYLNFILELKANGFEIASHGVGSGSFTREEILKGFELYKNKMGDFPMTHINHAQNPDNLYWGNRSGSKWLQAYARKRIPNEKFFGHDPNSKHFWGDFSKQNIQYIRGRVISRINTLKYDPKMPYRDKDKSAYSNFWFSSSDGANVTKFNELISKKNVNQLEKESGLCIVYTHFASGFFKDGILNKDFELNIRYLAERNGWFVPANEILDYLRSKNTHKEAVTERYLAWLDVKKFVGDKMKRLTR